MQSRRNEQTQKGSRWKLPKRDTFNSASEFSGGNSRVTKRSRSFPSYLCTTNNSNSVITWSFIDFPREEPAGTIPYGTHDNAVEGSKRNRRTRRAGGERAASGRRVAGGGRREGDGGARREGGRSAR